MEWYDLLVDGYGRVPEIMERVLKGLSADDVSWQPQPDCNSIGWLAWHLTRQQDAQIASLMGEKQVWIKDKWYEKFGREADPKDVGFGHTPEQLIEFDPPDMDTLLSYQQAVMDRSKSYLLGLSAADLDRVLDEPWFQPKPTVGVRIISILGDCLEHAGQMAYVRGLLQGKGWQKF